MDKSSFYSFNHQIEQLQREKDNLKKELAKEKIKEVSTMIYNENQKDLLNLREIENMLYCLYLDLKGIIED